MDIAINIASSNTRSGTYQKLIHSRSSSAGLGQFSVVDFQWSPPIFLIPLQRRINTGLHSASESTESPAYGPVNHCTMYVYYILLAAQTGCMQTFEAGTK